MPEIDKPLLRYDYPARVLCQLLTSLRLLLSSTTERGRSSMTKNRQRKTDFHLITALLVVGIVIFSLWTLFGCMPDSCLSIAPTAGSRDRNVQQLRDILRDAGVEPCARR